MAQKGSTLIRVMLDILKGQKEKAYGKSLDLSQAFISSVFYIFSWGGLYQNAVLHIYVSIINTKFRFIGKVILQNHFLCFDRITALFVIFHR